MALNSLSGPRCALWPALQMSRPKPAWFGSPAPAAAKSGNEVNERVVLGIFPSSQPNSNQTWALTSGMAHSSTPPASWGSGARGRRWPYRGHGTGQGELLEGVWGVGVGATEAVPSSRHQSLEKQKGTPAGPDWPPAQGGLGRASRPCWDRRSKTG